MCNNFITLKQNWGKAVAINNNIIQIFIIVESKLGCYEKIYNNSKRRQG